MADSPVKKIDFEAVGKENVALVEPLAEKLDVEGKKPAAELAKKVEQPAIVPGIKPDEVNEPLLQENPNRFVLFPIKYHEVRVDASRVY